MTRYGRVGAALLAVSLISTVQSIRALAFAVTGSERYETTSLLTTPVSFGGRTVAIRDSSESLDAHNRLTAVVWVTLDDSVIFKPQRIRVRPSGYGLGRYHGWLSATRFRDRDSGETRVIIARQATGAIGERIPEYELLQVTDGGWEHRAIPRSARASSWPVYHSIELFSDVNGVPSHAFSGLALGFPIPILAPIIWPWGTTLLGSILLAFGLVRARRGHHAT